MRFSAAAFMALPLLASAVETQDPLTQAKDTALHYYNLITSFVPHSNTYQAEEATAAKVEKNIDILTLDNWRYALRSSVTPASDGPEEWFLFLTGGNKTCWGDCDSVTKAFNESAVLFKDEPTAPHLGLINCDHQPVLCNSWATGPPVLYILEVTPGSEPVTVHLESFNSSTVTAQDFIKLHTTKSYKEKPAYEGKYFHPFNGIINQLGLGVPMGWVLWSFNVLPNWAFMILISFASRTLMSRRAGPQAPAAAARAPAGARAGARPGDAR